MNPDSTRAKFPPASWPVPPVRTLRGDADPVAAPSSAWAAPIRSGLARAELPAPEVTAEPAADLLAGLEIRTEPLPALEPDLPLADWTAAEDDVVLEAEIVPDQDDAEIILNDEVFWIDHVESVVDADAPVKGLHAIGDLGFPGAPAQAAEEPVEGLTATGDTVTPPVADKPDVEAPVEGLTTVRDGGVPIADLPVAEAPVEGLTPIGDVGIPVLDAPVAAVHGDPWEVRATAWDEPELEEQEESTATEWEALGQPLTESLAVQPEEVVEPVEDAEASEIISGGEFGANPRELATRLERLADQIRMHGTGALETAQAGGDSVEAALAKVLAGLVERETG